jgi:hypothetical protein
MCKCSGKPKKIPYGAKKKQEWCRRCDCRLVTIVNKGAERQKAKKQLKKDLEECS